jgi:hypothetical protein
MKSDIGRTDPLPLYNGINEGFPGTRVEIVSYNSLMILLILNAFLIYNRQRKN